MGKVLVLGAGMVSRPIVRYLLEQTDHTVTHASRTVSKAEKIIAGHERGTPQKFDITVEEDASKLPRMIDEHDLAVSLLPFAYHVQVAEECLKHRKHMVTTSYVSDDMKKLDGPARDVGVILLNEIGVDPGIDHMSAMRIIDNVHNKGGKIQYFCSYCGALPAPEACDNPLGYKFSWSPRGVVLAGRNAGKYLQDGKVVSVPGERLFEDQRDLTVEGLGEFEVYPNRDATGYVDIYGIPETRTMFRGTIRNKGWCDTWLAIAKLGLLEQDERDDLAGLTFGGLVGKLAGAAGGADLKQHVARVTGFAADSRAVTNIEWLGLLSEQPLPRQEGSVLDVLCDQLLKKLPMGEGERDMIALVHDFRAEYPDGKQEKISSTLIDYGIPHGDTSVARTVALPAAIATNLILQGEIRLTGMYLPVIPQLYEPVLKALEGQNIVCKERYEPL